VWRIKYKDKLCKLFNNSVNKSRSGYGISEGWMKSSLCKKLTFSQLEGVGKKIKPKLS
jgi:hypothetical protein